MKIKPLFDRVLLKQVKVKETSTSFGLVLPESSQEKPLIGEIVEVGDGQDTGDENIEMIVKKGDKVLFSKYAGTEFKIEQKEFIIIRQTDILAIIND